MRVLLAGGSAADATIAMGLVMTVTQPHYSHLGGDVFAVTYRAADGSVGTLNSSGPAPAGVDADSMNAVGSVPEAGGAAATVPGCVGGWWSLHARHGRLPWAALFDEAITLAGDGFAASRGLARAIAWWPARGVTDSHFDSTFGHVAGDGGQTVRQPALARTLEALRDGGAEAFYTGDIAEASIAALRRAGGTHTATDWVSPAEWAKPLTAGFRDHAVHTQPPPSRGMVLALALTDYERQLAAGEAPGLTRQFSALERAFDAVNAHAADPARVPFDAHELVRDYRPVELAGATAAGDGDTTYVLAIDREGNAVSQIQSVFAPWGSATWDSRTGILFNNRMAGFTPEPGHPNAVAGGKRPMHTLHCYLVTDAQGRLVMVGGSPGAHRQPTTNLQVLDGVLRLGLDAQDALDRPRWSVGPRQDGTPTVELEIRPGSPEADEFRTAGITVRPVEGWHGKMGRSFIAVRRGDAWQFAHDLRGEGLAIVL